MASFTFALYLLHYPLLQFYGALHMPVPALIAAVLGGVVLLGQVTERQKDGSRAWLMTAPSAIASDRFYSRLLRPH